MSPRPFCSCVDWMRETTSTLSRCQGNGNANGNANAGATATASQQATWSATSGKNIPTSGSWNGGPGGPSGPWRGGSKNGGDWTTNSNWQSWTSAHPTPAVTDAAAWSSWASSASWPTASSDWSSWASAKGLPSAAISGGGFPFAFGGPGPFSSAVLLLFDLAFLSCCRQSVISH